ncbi:proline hydroxylase [Epibacterium sp. SM1979]|uniref:Proline hydroxylase n=1 Tax=Tritonibacter litoralis TaxID=2662264 RepID=A0A843YII9_9RHOB|nr:2OG-Fe(II) oxygenase [Tritonibacter litoralis]MQQ10651.1 proline hydroxylase [Tritonibacter litoralis]
MSTSQQLEHRIDDISNSDLATDLNAFGCATIKGLLSPEQCVEISRLYPKNDPFRSHIHMARHGFGKGEYKYFSYPLPDLVTTLREQIYPKLVPVANGWNERMGLEPRFPVNHSDYIALCHTAGQERPTPLLLQYVKDDFNCLHQDVYGDLLFPLQMAVLLSRPEQDFTGGEFVLTEQRPRMQSRTEVVSLNQGDAVVFAVRNRPVAGSKRDYRVNMRHGVSRLKSGQRHTLGIIFHDAK